MLQNLFQFFAIYSEENQKYILQPGGYAALVILFALLLVVVSLSFKNEERRMNTKQLVNASMAMALAMVTSFIKFGSLPLGGSITFFSMFFICYIGYLYGPRIGIIAGIAYGILQLIVEPYIYHPLQLLLDYPLAFGALGLSGFFYKKKYGLMIGCMIGIIGRYIFHVISGYVYFSDHALEGLTFSITYNATYILPELIATIAILCVPAIASTFKEVKKNAI